MMKCVDLAQPWTECVAVILIVDGNAGGGTKSISGEVDAAAWEEDTWEEGVGGRRCRVVPAMSGGRRSV